jgi:hypothetical protein
MDKNSKQYDLEERTFEFARSVREFVKKLPRTIAKAMGSGMLFVIVVLLSDLNKNFSSIRNIFGK